jgi:orotate phosphoribosyltransferase
MDILNSGLAANVANELLRIKAVKLQPNDPFTWASGWKSPIYCDNRKTLSYPDVRKLIAKGLAQGVKEKFEDAEVVAGVATGAIAVGLMVAEELGLPFIYVRPKPKEHGLGNQIEGYLPENSKVVVIEDLISTGGSSLKAVDALRKTSSDCKIYTLSNYSELVKLAVDSGFVSESDLEQLIEWRKSPSTWKA